MTNILEHFRKKLKQQKEDSSNRISQLEITGKLNEKRAKIMWQTETQKMQKHQSRQNHHKKRNTDLLHFNRTILYGEYNDVNNKNSTPKKSCKSNRRYDNIMSWLWC